MKKVKILIVEDDPEISRLSAIYLKSEGYEVDIADDGLQAISMLKESAPDLMILDLMLPGMNGREVCERARQFFNGPIIILTACNDDAKEINMLRVGADDYLNKPIRPDILVARIEALLRRSAISLKTKLYLRIEQLYIDLISEDVYLNNVEVSLTSSERKLLLLLANNSGQVVTRSFCCGFLRGVDYEYNDRSIDMRISGIRKK